MVGESKGMKSRIQTKLEPLNYFFGILSNPEKPPTIEVQIVKKQMQASKMQDTIAPHARRKRQETPCYRGTIRPHLPRTRAPGISGTKGPVKSF